MLTHARPLRPSLPPIRLSDAQHQRLMNLAMRSLLRRPREAGALLQEISRADVAPETDSAPPTAGLGASVTFEIGGVRQVAVLVEHASSLDELSVLTNLGAGLLGLAPGQSIDWPDRVGGRRRLKVIAVSGPEAAEGGSGGSPPKTPGAAPPAPPPGEVVPFPRRDPPSSDDAEPPPSAA